MTQGKEFMVVEGVTLEPFESFDLTYFCNALKAIGVEPKEAQREYLDKKEELIRYITPALKKDYSEKPSIAVTTFLALCILAAAFQKSKDEFSKVQLEIERLKQIKAVSPWDPEVSSLGRSTLLNFDLGSRRRRNDPIFAIHGLSYSYRFAIQFPSSDPYFQSNYDYQLRINGDPYGEQLLENFGKFTTTLNILENTQNVPSQELIRIIRRG